MEEKVIEMRLRQQEARDLSVEGGILFKK